MIEEIELENCYIIGEHGEQVTFQQLADFYGGVSDVIGLWADGDINNAQAMQHIAQGFCEVFVDMLV